jgi:hypothetical protein
MARQAGKPEAAGTEAKRLLVEDMRRVLRSKETELQRKMQRKMQEDTDRILARLDVEIPEAMKEMDALLARLRTTRIVEAA